MRSFGRLLRHMRGVTPLSVIAERTALDERELASLEAGRQIANEVLVRHILRKGFALDRRATTRAILGVELYDLGLRDPDLRQFVIDLITRNAPIKVRERVKALYRSYTS